MVETIKYDKYDKYDKKDELLTILRNSLIKFNKTTSYTYKQNQYWEYIDLRVSIPLLKRARKLKETIEDIASLVYMKSDKYNYKGLFIKPKPVDLETLEIVEHDVVFDEIKDTIIQGIRNANFIIWAAVAWFTDVEILNELKLRKEAGVNIRIITSDESSNCHIIEELEENFDLVKVQLTGHYLSNRLHDKFCIIDLEYVMHESYNWSKNVRKNDETLATALDKDFVKKFAEEFIRLYNENKSKE